MHLAKRAGEIEATGTASRCSTRVVVIDDDPDDLWLLRRSLTRASDEGAPVDLSICRGPAVALDFLRSQNETSQRASSPDLMLIDVNMPDMSGIELLRVIRSIERFRDTAIMVMTSAVDEELAEEASAAGADAVILTGKSVDPYNPKVVRSTTGSLFHLPIAVGVDLPEAVEQAHAAGIRVVAADVDGTDFLASRDLLAEPTAWLFGNEARGLEEDALSHADLSLRLPIYGKAESLNLATAASVCLYETAFAQRSALA